MRKRKAVWWSILVAVLFVTVSMGQDVLGEFDMEYEDQSAAQTAGWVFQRPWQLVDARAFSGEPPAVRDFPSGTKAMYCGEVTAEGRGTYDLGYFFARLESPWVNIPSTCQYLKVSFKYCREVEYYTKGEYDITRCFLIIGTSTGGEEWFEIWRKDSRDPSQKEWQAYESDPIMKPENAIRAKICFDFDTVDGYANNFFGWFIDDVKLFSVKPPVRITAESLSPGVVGELYWCCLWADGPEDEEYTWSATGLPSRLTIESAGGHWGCIGGIPDTAGIFRVTVRVKAGRGGPGMEDEKTFDLVITAGDEEPILEEGFDTGSCYPPCQATLPLPNGWQATGLWHITNFTGRCLQGCGVAYYGKDECSWNPNYHTGVRTFGFLTSPIIYIPNEHEGKKLVISFVSVREVEDYPPGGYDKAWVEVKLGSGEWTKVWERDSADPQDDCEWINIMTDLVVPAATAPIPFQIRFGFDSVDSYQNHFFGWAVDSVKVAVVPTPLRITVPDTLPEGWIAEDYRLVLTAEGGVRRREWQAVGLPDGLGVREEAGVWVIAGSPRVAGRFNVTLKVRDIQGNEDEKTCLLVINAQRLLFKETFEVAGTWSSWTATGLWRRTNDVPNVDMSGHGYVAYYGLPEGHYDKNDRTKGALTSPVIALNGVTRVRISFDYWREVEFYAQPYDRTYVQVCFKVEGEWQSWTIYWSKDSTTPSEKAWTPTEFVVNAPAGATHMQIQFVFDSVDKYYNRFRGWLVDNVKVVEDTGTGPASVALSLPSALAREGFTVFNVPNPVRDVHTTTFVVRGVEAERIRVEVYDLTGKLVWKGEALGNELTWHTEDLTGLPLANGVYLYKVYVEVGEAWIVSDVRKIVILR